MLRTSEIIVIPLGHSSDLQKWKKQLCATTLRFFGISQKLGTLLLRLWKMKFSPIALGPFNSMWFFWDTHRTSKNAKTSSVRSILYFLKFFKNQVLFSLDFEKWNSLPGPKDLRNHCDSFGTLIGPPKMQNAALCDQYSIFWNFSKIRYASHIILLNLENLQQFEA